ncbi:MAG TPA: sulfatase-like hydrolase/transferase [Phycisphaerae bacterium]|nr:sulfatase-like hydrolase/transferase [Phycisphaerae bacterium]HOJ75379.1 sulfatase-like hydrolase/transferase [Phycisphaerae bacterium]HOM52619.1 sulfatase-like hydrolase/transferase [Phycisphaerae bacterium]HON66741.1 sulfatase-like hydrolase/transferase [Phycisphaerae bacterium]HOQ85407.1 sulfatase-like hydrolase/transferase [Phycisphaerae bacterium]
MSRRSMLALAALLSATAAAAPGPNVIIIYSDDMGIGDVGCYGATDIRTPHLDALAANGVRFTNYYSAAPVCSPSRAALLTGRYPLRAGVPTNVSSQPGAAGMPAEQITFAELARSRGYATALTGKWHLGFSDDTRPNAQGFDEFFGHHAGCIDFYSHMFYWQNPPHHDLYRNREEIHEEGQYMTDLIAREAIRFIRSQATPTSGERKPFLLYVAFNAPHYPMQAPERFRRMYADLPAERAIYAAMVTAMDDAIGRILQTLDDTNLADDTFVFFACDNGATTELRANGKGGSNGPHRGHKFSLFEGGIHLPAIVRWPKVVPRGQTRDQLVCAIDVWPTSAEIMGAEVPADHRIDGMSLIPVLKDPNAPGHDALFWKQGEQEATRQGRWKLVMNGLDTGENDQRTKLTGEDAIFLADLQTDPAERRNLRREHPELVRELQQRHEQWQSDLGLASKPRGLDEKTR